MSFYVTYFPWKQFGECQKATLLVSPMASKLEFDTRQFSAENCKKFAEAIYEKSQVYKHIVGFMDGTMQKNCYPQEKADQKIIYSEWKHIHYLKYYAIVTPDDITSSLLGPFTESRTLDCLILHLSTLTSERNSGLHYVIYGDQAYQKSLYVYRSFTVYEIKEHSSLKEVNRKMSQTRVQVKMEFGKISQYFKYCKYHYSFSIERATIAIFGLPPPKIEEYIARLMCEQQSRDTINNVNTILDNLSNLV
ncbi:hypothetical protein PHYBLDRAFT_173203 [Phycomyces blakesleeanus NRRL 1555(-)]|uniref:DDE Tnp4 domain-containing protein n=1 Tax=Phycomyces blakesleeanus (strain ATCC 8743b / DSM 1359 / FGSC 10004 / NBRC 33097 / NRRL 1555) TaxID=763407 RepID=A0A167KSR5_PHYB8|nr:hypothetical protein PHYBLDRAFT_173203 [Phycomyces blakesleeanus NRRL 1555(-)]OAD68788.1 hypothetical protein PHYBLDRAFT_173203 [Phycomyces blakesleeanus NRRL 1555(-)]|eukprot:XP_018286828.1 hypothetical protein PHYBLDRAFT_173203 [Phycomyces blakesleeanus NRRL 1555(-)]